MLLGDLSPILQLLYFLDILVNLTHFFRWELRHVGVTIHRHRLHLENGLIELVANIDQVCEVAVIVDGSRQRTVFKPSELANIDDKVLLLLLFFH